MLTDLKLIHHMVSFHVLLAMFSCRTRYTPNLKSQRNQMSNSDNVRIRFAQTRKCKTTCTCFKFVHALLTKFQGILYSWLYCNSLLDIVTWCITSHATIFFSFSAHLVHNSKSTHSSAQLYISATC